MKRNILRIFASLAILSFIFPNASIEAQPTSIITNLALTGTEPQQDLLVEINSELEDLPESTEKRVYIPPSPEVIAKTRAQVENFTCTDDMDVPKIECEALVALYESTNGAGWYRRDNWLITNTVGNWFQVTVVDGHVIDLRLTSNNLQGSIPAKFGDLQYLQVLYLNNNILTGNIPAELGNLSNLVTLGLNYNSLSGSIPLELGKLSRLNTLDLGHNQLSDSIPPAIGIGNLSNLYLNDNQLTGSIPTEIGNATLIHLHLNNNKLTGDIPLKLSDTIFFNDLDLSYNQLSGSIPPELGGCSGLMRINLSNNQLSGIIPAEFGNLNGLIDLDLSNNQLSGEIPSGLGNSIKLETLYLFSNQLTGAIPLDLGKLTKLKNLSLYSNQLTGIIPSELGNLAALRSLFLNNNQLSGSIPHELGNLSSLSTLTISSNSLTGSLPLELGNLSNLSSLQVSDNLLSGGIPLNFISLSRLYSFHYENTFICEPADPEFLLWKATVADWGGTDLICKGPSAWLLLYYLDGDNNLDSSYEYIFNYLEYGASVEDVVIVSLWDRFGNDGTTQYNIKFDSNLSKLGTYLEGVDKWSQDELNMGDPSTLSNFLSWAKSSFPAEHYVLIMDDHGSGLGGSMVDDTSDKDLLTLYETKTALASNFSSSEKLDILVMNACLMGLVENGHQFKDYVNYYVASEDLQYVFDEGYADTLAKITASTEPLSVAKAFVDGYKDDMASWNNFTMSVVDLSFSDSLKSSIDHLATQINSDLLTIGDVLWSIRDTKVQKFPPDYEELQKNDEGIYTDLMHLAQLISSDDSFSQDIRDAADSVITNLANYIIYNKSSYENAYGASIFFPDMRRSFYDGDNNDFAFGTEWYKDNPLINVTSIQSDPIGWGNFLVNLFEVIDPGGEDDPNEPSPLAKPVTHKIFLPTIIR